MPSFFVPPGGFSGFSQMTPASRAALAGGVRRAPSRRRTKKKRASSARRSSSRKRGTSRKSKLKFGSPAWQKKYRVGKFAKKR